MRLALSLLTAACFSSVHVPVRGDETGTVWGTAVREPISEPIDVRYALVVNANGSSISVHADGTVEVDGGLSCEDGMRQLAGLPLAPKRRLKVDDRRYVCFEDEMHCVEDRDTVLLGPPDVTTPFNRTPPGMVATHYGQRCLCPP